MAPFDEEPSHKRTKYSNDDHLHDSLSHHGHDDKNSMAEPPLSLKVEPGHEMIDNEIIQQQRAQEEQEKAAEEEARQQKEYINESGSPSHSDVHDGGHEHDGGHGLGEHEHELDSHASNAVNNSLLAATATAALARSGSTGPDSQSHGQPQSQVSQAQSPSSLGQSAANALTALQSHHSGLAGNGVGLGGNGLAGNVGHHQNLDLSSISQFQSQQQQQQQQVSSNPHSHLNRYNPMSSNNPNSNPSAMPPQPPSSSSSSTSKPAVGTDEWHRQRRDSHKEVERRRRETINDGIRELSELVPNCEKNKGQILRRAVDYIRELKENEAGRMEKWTMDKILSEQAISEVSASNEKLKQELKRAWREAAIWKKACTDANIKPPEDAL